jgi:transketolase
LENQHGPTALALTRQGVPTFGAEKAARAKEGALRGGYILRDVAEPQVILIGTGSEVHIALAGAALLAEKGVQARVVSMPSWELFEKQPAEYREMVLPPSITARVSIEAGTPLGWERYVGLSGKAIGIHRFGASAPYQMIYEKLGLTAEAVAETAVSLLS